MTLKQMYAAEVKRINQQIKRLEKRGFEFAEPVLPKEPKRIRRESVGRLQKIDLPSIKSKATKAPEPKRSKAKSITTRPSTAMPRVTKAEEPRTGRVRNLNRSEYAKQRRRINSFLRSAEKRGYVVPEGLYQEPNMYPSSQDVERLKGIRPNDLYQQIYGVDPDTGEAIPGVVERDRRRKESARRGAETRRRKKEQIAQPPLLGDLVLANVERIIAQFDPGMFRSRASRIQHYENNDKIQSLLNGAIRTEGRTAVGERLYFTGAELVYSTVMTVQYDSDQGNVEIAVAAFSSWILGRPLSQAEAQEIGEDYESYEEY